MTTADAKRPPPLITVRGLRVIRGAGGPDPFTLEVAALDVPKGSFTTILGESGCGKTTLLMVLALMRGPEEPDFSFECEELTFHLGPATGDVEGRSVRVYENAGSEHRAAALDLREREELRRRLVGFCLQGGELIPSLSLLDNVSIPRVLSDLDAPAEHAIERLRQLRLEARVGNLPRQLSGGQQQRGVFARALIHDPPLVILDEPTAALDRMTAEGAISILKSQTQELGQTVVMVTHDRHLAEGFSDFLVMMDVTRERVGTITTTEWRRAAQECVDPGDTGATDRAGPAPLVPGGDSGVEPAALMPGGDRREKLAATLPQLRLGLMDALGPVYGTIQDLIGKRPPHLRGLERTRDYRFVLQSAQNALVIVAIGLLMLLLRGMRSGLIEDFRQDLLRSPTARELVVTPLVTTAALTEDALAELTAQNPEIELVIPSTTHVAFPTDAAERDQSITLVGTLPADPMLNALFADQDFSRFDENAVVLPGRIAEELGTRVGAEVTLWIARVVDAEGLEKEIQPAVLRVSNILPEDQSRTAYVHLDFAGDIADFKAGRPVEARGWLGRPQPIEPRYAAFLLFAKNRLSGRETTALESRGLEIEELGLNDPMAALHGLRLGEDAIRERELVVPRVYRLRSGRQEGDLRWLNQSIWNIENLLTDSDGIMLPWNEPLSVRLDGEPLTLLGLSATPRWLRRYVDPPGAVFPKGESGWLVTGVDGNGGESGTLEVDGNGASVRIPIRIAGRDTGASRPVATAPAAMVAHLLMATMGVAEPDTQLGIFRAVAAEEAYYRARVFVQDVYNVVDVHERLSHDFAVRSEHARVKEVQRYQTTLDHLVNVLSVISAVIVFATVWIVFHDLSERKKRMIGTLRIMGLSQRGVVVLLLAHGVLVASIACVLLTVLGGVSSSALNLIAGKSACVLTGTDFLWVALAILGVCLLGTYVPARAASRIDPVVALEQAQQQG